MNKKNKRIILILVAVLAIAGISMFVLYNSMNAEPARHPVEKTVTVNVVLPTETRTYEHTTREVYVRGLLEEMQLVEGEESQYGLFIKTVDGVTANDANSEWWRFDLNGEMSSTGIEKTLFADGDVINLTLVSGYENF